MHKKFKKAVLGCNKHADEDNRGLKTVRAKSIRIEQYSPEELRSIGEFLIQCAAELKKSKHSEFHKHYRSVAKKWNKEVLDIEVNFKK